MNEERTHRFLSFLDAHHVMSLATAGADGPHAANLFYVRDGFALLWVSDPASRHSLHLETAPRVAATIAPDYSEFQDVRGIQIFGAARRIAEPAGRADARRLMEARYAFLRVSSDAPVAVQEAYARAEFYRLDPIRMVMIDNARGFGGKHSLEFLV
jgi:uncharacterized protein